MPAHYPPDTPRECLLLSDDLLGTEPPPGPKAFVAPMGRRRWGVVLYGCGFRLCSVGQHRPRDGVIRYEPCPHCKGTGKRVAAPPYVPEKRGRPKGNTPARHGRPSAYSNGCRCDLCRAAWREYMRPRNRKLRGKRAS